MTKTARIGMLLALLAIVPTSGASAQIIPMSFELDAGAGFFWFTQKSENLKHNVDINFKFNIHFTQIVGFEASIGIVPTKLRSEAPDLGVALARTNYVNPNFGVIFHFTKAMVVPFVYVGAGFSHYNILGQPGDTIDCSDCYSVSGLAYDSEDGPQYKTTDVDFQVAAGAGFKILFTERFGMRADVRYLFTHDAQFRDAVITSEGEIHELAPDTGNLECKGINNFHHMELTGSLFVLIGGKLDSDGDGVTNPNDACPEDPEDADGYEDGDGCPDFDNDGDRIPDANDQCVNDPEDLDGYEDRDGCPEYDNDGDGITDDHDSCPNDPEDRDGFEDDDGCSEHDNDADGVVDAMDRCAMEPEDKDGWEDADGCPDTDNEADGFLDAEDACPNSAGKLWTTDTSKNGCPENDSDKDGILDEDDQCQTDPEDRDGFEDEDGCPEHDNDADGIPDQRDTCPNDAEDKDGWDDMDGCPDTDNDGDGFPDETDACPNDKENRNGFEDEDGCPDEIPEELQKFTGVIAGIQFKVNSDELLSASFPILNEAADILSQYPGIRMEIQGHASSDGDDNHNMVLSQKRADSVRRYLINRGITSDRLTSIGYGETTPIADNATQEGRVMNRRVEFKIIQPDE